MVIAGCLSPHAAPDQAPVDRVIVAKADAYDTYLEHPAAAFYVHDYWQAKESVVLIDQTLSWSSVPSGRSPTLWSPAWVPADGLTVLPGTDQVNVTVDLSGLTSTPGKFTLVTTSPLSVKLNESAELPVPASGRLVLATDEERNDKPHQLLSFWGFRLKYEPSGSAGYVYGKVGLKAELHRGARVPSFAENPVAHPFQGVRRVLEASGSAGQMAGSACVTECPPTLQADKTVPVGTKSVLVNLTVTAAGPEANPRLSYRSAESRAWQALAPQSTSGSVLRFEIPVTATTSDSPYVNATSWAFRLTGGNAAAAGFQNAYDFVLEAQAVGDGKLLLAPMAGRA